MGSDLIQGKKENLGSRKNRLKKDLKKIAERVIEQHVQRGRRKEGGRVGNLQSGKKRKKRKKRKSKSFFT